MISLYRHKYRRIIIAIVLFVIVYKIFMQYSTINYDFDSTALLKMFNQTIEDAMVAERRIYLIKQVVNCKHFITNDLDLTTNDLAGLGNKIYELVSTYGIARTIDYCPFVDNHRTAIIHYNMERIRLTFKIIT
jgi:hypothetical protein